MENQDNNNNDISDYIFVGFMFIGGGIGLATGQVAAGGAVGMGVGFIAYAIYSSQKNKSPEKNK